MYDGACVEMSKADIECIILDSLSVEVPTMCKITKSKYEVRVSPSREEPYT